VSGHLGHVQLQHLTEAHLDNLVTDLQKNGRRVGNKQQQGLGPRSINLMLTLLSQVLDDAVRQGTVGRNVAKMVERVRQSKKEMRTWTEAEARAFLGCVESDRLNPAWQLSLRGLRRGEVLGLCWTDIDLLNKTLTIRRERIEVAGVGIVEDEPKTTRSRRTLPLDDARIAALRALKAQQAQERLAGGKVYTPACADCGGAHVAVDEIGRPYRPEWYSDQFRRLFKAAGLPMIRLHDARHTSGTLMILQGVPITVVSAWHGHATASFTLATYAHSQDDALTRAGETLAGVYRASQGGL
jgi:integrase